MHAEGTTGSCGDEVQARQRDSTAVPDIRWHDMHFTVMDRRVCCEGSQRLVSMFQQLLGPAARSSMYQAGLNNSYCADLQIHIEITGLCQSDVELRSLVKTPNMNTAFSGSGQKCVQRNSTVVRDFIFQPCPACTSSEQCQQDD